MSQNGIPRVFESPAGTQVVGFQRTYAWEALIQPDHPTRNKTTATNRGEQHMGHTPTITFTDTPRARRTDPESSHEAADTNNCTGSLLEVMDLFTEFGPMADHELVERHAGFTYTPQRLRTARSELADAGLVEFTGIYRLTPSNRRARVWALL